MTPFGVHMRTLRAQKQVTLKDMAAALGVSSAYLSALEHGKRGRPSWYLLQRIINYFNIIWDDAEELVVLARLSHPKVTIDTSNLSPLATQFANRLADDIAKLDEENLRRHIELLDEATLANLKNKS